MKLTELKTIKVSAGTSLSQAQFEALRALEVAVDQTLPIYFHNGKVMRALIRKGFAEELLEHKLGAFTALGPHAKLTRDGQCRLDFARMTQPAYLKTLHARTHVDCDCMACRY